MQLNRYFSMKYGTCCIGLTLYLSFDRKRKDLVPVEWNLGRDSPQVGQATQLVHGVAIVRMCLAESPTRSAVLLTYQNPERIRSKFPGVNALIPTLIRYRVE